MYAIACLEDGQQAAPLLGSSLVLKSTQRPCRKSAGVHQHADAVWAGGKGGQGSHWLAPARQHCNYQPLQQRGLPCTAQECNVR